MSNAAKSATTDSPSSIAAAGQGNEMGILDLIVLLSRYKTTIACVVVLTGVLAGIASLLLPDMYTATTTILPPEQAQSAAKSLVGQVASAGGLSASDLGLANPGDLYIAMLKGRSVQDAMVDQFDLRRTYSVRTYAAARKNLDDRSEVLLDKEGLISISVSDHSPERAVQLANGYVDQLRKMSHNLARSEAGQRRVFYAQNLAAERESLSAAELFLKQAQEQTGLVLPEAQGQAMIQSVSRTQAELAMAEVKLEEMRTFATPDNPGLKRAEVEVAGLRRQLDSLEHSRDSSGNGNVELPVHRLPEAELDYVRRARDLKYHESLYEFLGKQLDAARIDEARQGEILEVVDEASMPERRSGPDRTSIVLAAVGAAFFFCCFVIMALEAVRRNEYTAAHLDAFWRWRKWTP